MKQLALDALTSEYVSPLVRPLVRGADTVFTLHRFDDPERGVRGQDPAALRASLSYLRKHRYELVSIADIVTRFIDGTADASSAIAFTVDDGYYDWYEVGAPIFAEFDCPITVFLPTGFIDGKLWNWWDQVAFALASASRSVARIEIGGSDRTLRWQTPAERDQVYEELIGRLERIPTEEKLAAIAALASSLEVELPEKPPAKYAPMTWSEVRAAGARGATFGPHTVTHPILSQCSAVDCRFEIEESWRRLQEETSAIVPVFAYPNGLPHAFSLREADAVRRAGLQGAVTTGHRYVERGTTPREALAPFLVPRFSFPSDRAHLVQLTTGLERAKLALLQAVGLRREYAPAVTGPR
jgi:peptidoglycan/xylan/chitin deacetylase (PgdA/CDA1 family)